MRGREVPPRTAVVQLARHLPHSASVQCEHPADLGSSATGSLLAVTPLRRLRQKSPVPPLLGKPQAAWLYLGAIPPDLCRGKPRQKCSGQPGGSRSGCWRSVYPPSVRIPQSSRKYTLRRWGSARLRHPRPTSDPAVGLSGPGRGGRLPSPRCRYLPLRRRAAQRPRSASAALRLLGHWETRCRPTQSHRTHPAVNETLSNQGLPTTYARTLVPIRPTEARSEVEKNVKTFYLEAAAAAAAGCDERQRIRSVTDVR